MESNGLHQVNPQLFQSGIDHEKITIYEIKSDNLAERVLKETLGKIMDSSLVSDVQITPLSERKVKQYRLQGKTENLIAVNTGRKLIHFL